MSGGRISTPLTILRFGEFQNVPMVKGGGGVLILNFGDGMDMHVRVVL